MCCKHIVEILRSYDVAGFRSNLKIWSSMCFFWFSWYFNIYLKWNISFILVKLSSIYMTNEYRIHFNSLAWYSYNIKIVFKKILLWFVIRKHDFNITTTFRAISLVLRSKYLYILMGCAIFLLFQSCGRIFGNGKREEENFKYCPESSFLFLLHKRIEKSPKRKSKINHVRWLRENTFSHRILI